MTDAKDANQQVDDYSRWAPLDRALAEAGGLRPDQLRDLGRFTAPIFEDGALPANVKLFALFLIALTHGHDETAERAILRAIRNGLTRAQLIDGLMAGVLSRGITVFWKGQRWLGEFPDDQLGTESLGREVPGENREAMLDYFAKVYKTLPTWVADLAEASPEFFDGYFHHRSNVLRDGAFAHHHKELMITSINAVDRYPFGLEHHMKGALAVGATRAEIIEIMLVAVAAGGMPAFLEAHHVLDRLTGRPS